MYDSFSIWRQKAPVKNFLTKRLDWQFVNLRIQNGLPEMAAR